LTRKLRENAALLHRKEQRDKSWANSSQTDEASSKYKPDDFTLKVILPKPHMHALLIMPPEECKIVRELSPHEKHLIKLHEKRERIKAIKNK